MIRLLLGVSSTLWPLVKLIIVLLRHMEQDPNAKEQVAAATESLKLLVKGDVTAIKVDADPQSPVAKLLAALKSIHWWNTTP